MERGGKVPLMQRQRKRRAWRKENRGKEIKMPSLPPRRSQVPCLWENSCFWESPTGQKEDRWQVIVTGGWGGCECDYPQRGKHGFNRCNSEEDGRKYSLQESAAAAESLQSCPTLCDPMDGSPPGSSVHGIFQARVLEWGAITFYSRNLREVYFQDIFRLRFPPNCLYLFYF